MSKAHTDLCRSALTWLSRSHMVVGTEMHVGRDEPDCFGICGNGYSTYVECKTTRSDYLRDKLKPHRRSVVAGHYLGIGHRRYFFTLPGVIKDGDDLAGWGHVIVDGRARVMSRKHQAAYFETDTRDTMALMVRMFRVLAQGRECQSGTSYFYHRPWPAVVADVAAVDEAMA